MLLLKKYYIPFHIYQHIILIIKNIHEVSKFRELESLNNMWNRFMEKEIKISIEFNKVIDIILKLTIPICMAIENKEEYNKTWDFRELGYI